MSLYFKPGKGWRYDFTLKGKRYTEAWFKTKAEAKKVEAKRKEEVENPQAEPEQAMVEGQLETPTVMGFLDLLNRRLDHVKAYNSASHFETCMYSAKAWAKRWNGLACNQITSAMIQDFLFERRKVSAYTANRELRYLRATFNFGIKKKWIAENPTEGIEFMPVEKRVRYVPPIKDVTKVLELAEPDVRDYLVAIWHTMARVSEINRLTWDDISLEDRYVILYTRKKKGGHLTPRKVSMTSQLHEILSRRFKYREPEMQWIFWTQYTHWKTGEFQRGKFSCYRRTILQTLCEKASIRKFTFHALRHSGASIMDNANVPTGSIQRILGHENRTTTEIYLHSLGDAEKLAIAEFV